MPPTVTLRPVEEQDLTTFFDHQRDAVAARMAAFIPRNEPDFIAHWNRILVNPDCLARTIVADGDVTGNIGSFRQGEERLVGYWIGREHWGRGIASEALKLFVAIDRIRPLRALVASHNVGSIHVLRNAGFVRIAEEATDFQGEPMVELVFELPG